MFGISLMSWDEIVTSVADSGSDTVRQNQATNDATLEDRFRAILAKPDLSPDDRLRAEKAYAQFKAGRQDPITGNGKLFVDEYKKTATEVASVAARGIAGTLFDEFLPLTLTLIGLVAFLIFVKYYPDPK